MHLLSLQDLLFLEIQSGINLGLQWISKKKKKSFRLCGLSTSIMGPHSFTASSFSIEHIFSSSRSAKALRSCLKKEAWGGEGRTQEGRGVPYNPAAACKSPCNSFSSRIFLRLYRGSSFLILSVPAMCLCFIYLRCSHPGMHFPSAASWEALLTVSHWLALLPPS